MRKCDEVFCFNVFPEPETLLVGDVIRVYVYFRIAYGSGNCAKGGALGTPGNLLSERIVQALLDLPT